MTKTFSASKKGSALEILIYDQIGGSWFSDGITASWLAAQIKEAGDFDSFSVRINSPGGNVFEGVTISNLLRAQGKPINVTVDGVAASIASIIALAGDTIAMGQGAMFMIHNASTMASGCAGDLRGMAETLDKISATMAETYAAKTGKTVEAIQALMDAETWFTADESVKEGFATSVIPVGPSDRKKALALAATFARQFRNAPAFEAPEPEPEVIPTPIETESPDWEGQLSVYKKRLELAGK